ncbi:GrpB family protein [Prosthecochloris sp.]|uniref:GrpB family protein n=1 Tax=Prosthecochloris sp. TaxID=290513 RepID=UPI0025D726CD|nr:GrpB family protein [Prosthecochloris sp.]
MKRIIVSKYNPGWIRDFELLHDHIWPHISDVALSLEHVGSTSVPGLAAKPIIDLTIVAPNKETLKIIIKRLSSIGALHRGNLGIEGREAFTTLEGFPEHNLYACIAGCQALENHLAIRNALRANTSLATRYGKIKLELAQRYFDDIDSYVEGKSSFLLAILRDHGFTSDELEEIQENNRKKS